MLERGLAYHCYCSQAELDAMRAAQMARKEKPRYDGRWRPRMRSAGRRPPGVLPVIRFRNPGRAARWSWTTSCTGRIVFAQQRARRPRSSRARDGTPTYNFCVVVDDCDMGITHVIRGDDHLNNTPRQINMLRALGATPPVYAHVPMILGEDGAKLSKRHGAVSVMEYQDEGYLPEAMLNYLARLGWSHGDQEIFSRAELVEWFDLAGISPAPSRFNAGKLNWVNQEHMKRMPEADLGARACAVPRARRASTRPPGRPRRGGACCCATARRRWSRWPTPAAYFYTTPQRRRRQDRRAGDDRHRARRSPSCRRHSRARVDARGAAPPR